MGTPSVIQVDANASLTLSPLQDETFRSGRDKLHSTESRRSRRNAVEKASYHDMRTKYTDAKIQMERMKQESENNKRRLLEISGVISALKDISIDYDRDCEASGSPALNVERKVRAIDEQLKSAMMHCGHLEQEKEIQSSTIKAQEGQIKNMEDQIVTLQERLQQTVDEKKSNILKEREALREMNQTGEMKSIIMEQEHKIHVLEEQVRRFSTQKDSAFYQQVAAFKGFNDAKYLEIYEMDKKLEILRSAQQGQSTQQLVVYSGDSKASKHVSFDPDATDQHEKKSKTTYSIHSYSSGSSTSSRSSASSDRGSLASISEGESARTEEFDSESGAREMKWPSPSFSGDESSSRGFPSVRISSSGDDSVEVTMRKPTNDRSSIVSSSTSSSTKSHEHNFDESYKKAMTRIQALEAENAKLRKDNKRALSDMAQLSDLTANSQDIKMEHEKMKRALDEQKQSATLANTKYEKLRREHAKTLDELKDERVRYEQLMDDYDRVAHREADIATFEKLKQLHSAVVMKMADLGEENDLLQVQQSKMRSELDAAESKNRALESELEATKAAYEDLHKENTETNTHLAKLTHQLDLLKTKYYETLAGDESIHTGSVSSDDRYEAMKREYESVLDKLRSFQAKAPAHEHLRREHAEVLAKLEVLEQTNKELEKTKEKYHATEAQVTILQRSLDEATALAESAKKREEKRALHLKDLLSHYKALESEHDEVSEKLKRLQAVMTEESNKPSGEDPFLLGPAGPEALADQAKAAAFLAKITACERRIKELQQQRDNAVEQMSQLEEELSRTRLEKLEALNGKKSREQDLKTVLEHYHALQRKMDEVNSTIALQNEASKADATHHTAITTGAVLGECKDEQQKTCLRAETMEDEDLVSEIPQSDTDQQQQQLTPVDELNVQTTSTPSTQVQISDAISNSDAPMQAPQDEDSVARLLVDMEILKRKKEDRASDVHKTDMSTVSNVSEGISLDGSNGNKSALSDEAPSTSWKDVKIAKLLSALEEAKSQVWAAEEREKDALSRLEIAERKEIVARRESEDAKKRQNAREGNLRDVIAQQKKLEKDHEQVQEEVSELQQQLEKAKKEVKLREEETKAARQRAASYHTQFKKLQEKHNEVIKIVQDQERRLQMVSTR